MRSQGIFSFSLEHEAKAYRFVFIFSFPMLNPKMWRPHKNTQTVRFCAMLRVTPISNYQIIFLNGKEKTPVFSMGFDCDTKKRNAKFTESL